MAFVRPTRHVPRLVVVRHDEREKGAGCRIVGGCAHTDNVTGGGTQY